ncbi:MAG TPA: hypothetical protein VHS03_12005 [Gaiellaceae bacterium]|nr:hypothetical protein [Gaiellaceae bacterium]
MTALRAPLRPSALTREALVASGGAAILSAFVVWIGPPGNDFAAHVYQRALYLQHGFELWNNFWYAGRYSFINYSVLYYPLAAWIGIKILAVATIAVAALAFAVVVLRQWGLRAKWSSRTFAVVWAASVLTGAFPFALGAALALLAVLALQRRHVWRFALLCVLTTAASPLAFLLLALILVGIGIARRTDHRLVLGAGLAIAIVGLVEVALWRVFPNDGFYPFSIWELLGALVFCGFGIVLSWGIEGSRVLRFVFPVYAAGCVIAFFVPSALGDNVLRVRYLAVPIAVLLLTLREWRPRLLAFVALGLALSWNISPLVGSVTASAGDPSSSASYWAPAIRYLHRHLTPSFRVEAVDTSNHWEAYYLPKADIPIVRGWFRQEDFPQNKILYGKFGPKAYLAWLRGLGVRYIVLANAPPDYSSAAESALLRSGRLPVNRVRSTPTVTIFAVPHARSMVTGPGRASIVSLKESSLAVRVGKPGTYRIAIHYSGYFQAAPGCITSGKDGMIRLHAPRAGVVRMTFRVSAGQVLEQMAGAKPDTCSK